MLEAPNWSTQDSTEELYEDRWKSCKDEIKKKNII